MELSLIGLELSYFVALLLATTSEVLCELHPTDNEADGPLYIYISLRIELYHALSQLATFSPRTGDR
jgi:hypothetical protein